MNFFLGFLIFFCISILAIIIAAKNNFFHLEKGKEKIEVNFVELTSVFFIYFSSNIFLYPVINKYLISSKILASFFVNLIIFIIFFVIVFKKNFFNLSNLKKDIKIGFFSFFLAFPIVMFLILFINFIIQDILKIKELPDQRAIEYLKYAYHTPYLFFAIIIIVFFAPFIEEFLFRGCLQSFLKKYFSYKVSILISSFLFSLLHFSFSQKISNIPIIFVLFFLGIFLGFLFEKQKSLTASITLHATFNIFNILNFMLLKKYLGVF